MDPEHFLQFFFSHSSSSPCSEICFSFHDCCHLSLSASFLPSQSFCSVIARTSSYTGNIMATLTRYQIMDSHLYFPLPMTYSLKITWLSSFGYCFLCVGCPWITCSESIIILWGITWNWPLSSFEYCIKNAVCGRHSKARPGKSTMISGNVSNSKNVLHFYLVWMTFILSICYYIKYVRINAAYKIFLYGYLLKMIIIFFHGWVNFKEIIS